MIKPLNKTNIIVRPYVVHKDWTLTETSEGIVTDEGLQITSSVFDSDTDEQNSSGNYKRSVFNLMNQMFYSTSGSYQQKGGSTAVDNENRVLHDRINVLSIPMRFIGEEIRPGSIRITESSNGVAKTYVDDSSGSLVDLATGSQYVGNVFYQHGFITCTHTGSYYSSSFLQTGSNGFTVEFESTRTLYERELIIQILPGEFNISTNPTAVQAPTTGSLNDYYSGSYNDIVYDQFRNYEASSSTDHTGSYLTPYATTIGFYDDDLTLLAVAKFPRPLKLLPEYPINVLIRFDT